MTHAAIRPPRLAVWLVHLAAPAPDAAFVLGDFLEQFENVARQRGAAAARRWYWAEVARSVPPLARRKVKLAVGRRTVSQPGIAIRESLLDDARFAARLSRRSPVASLTIIGTIILGIGATTAVFSTVNALLLRPLPFPRSERVVELQGLLRGGQAIDNLAYPDLVDFRRDVRDFAALSVFSESEQTLERNDGPQLLRAVQVDPEYPAVFGIRLALGRFFSAEELQPNGPKAIILSNALWLSALGGDRGVIGRVLTIDDEPARVVGVLAPGAYTYPRPEADVMAPLVIAPNTMYGRRGAMWAGAAALLAPGSTLAQAGRDLSARADRLGREFPASNEGIGARIRPLQQAVIGEVSPMLRLLAAVVAAVLLIACINIANLLLARARVRAREFALRSALGGSPMRVRRQVFTEALLLALIGGVGGIAAAPWLIRGLLSVYPGPLPRANEIAVDGRVLLFATAATLLAGILSAVPAARRAARVSLIDDLRDGRRSGHTRGERRFGGALIVMQVAASLAVLFSAGLLLQTFRGLTRVDPGFDARNRLTFHLYAAPARYGRSAEVASYFDKVTNALREIPGVAGASTTTLMPFGGGYRYDVFVDELLGDQGTRNPAGAVAVVSPGLDRDLGLSLVRGRWFVASDDSSSEPVAVINEALARRMFAGAPPVGQRIGWSARPLAKTQGRLVSQPWRIVGVVRTARMLSLSEDPMPMLYVPSAQAVRSQQYVVLRLSRPPAEVLPAVRAALRSVDPTIAATDVATIDERLEQSLTGQHFRATLMTALGGLALLLAVIGIHGVVANTVSRRVHEIGVRIALGEAGAAVGRRVVLETVWVATKGIAIGVLLALVAGHWLAAFLVGVSPRDPRLLAASAIALLTVVAAAAITPALRAARVDPITALRAE